MIATIIYSNIADRREDILLQGGNRLFYGRRGKKSQICNNRILNSKTFQKNQRSSSQISNQPSIGGDVNLKFSIYNYCS